MQDEPTPTELIKAVADFLRTEIAPAIKGHNAFKLRVGINALDRDAAGRGWFIDPTPADDAEFSGDHGQLVAGDGAAQTEIDLLRLLAPRGG